ncbi:GNAT family N-acetyltransferase [Modicisalibacter luteus]|uniref:GNAT family N-acetyltransferase n=1 Tax=Modicisalibacter luteus TaxID=453962 RepID=A0ABV7M3G8_9GAMM|nr:GNAT family N-acetyltransferase [Halomonas lutea]
MVRCRAWSPSHRRAAAHLYPYLTDQKSWLALIEGVRIHRDYRSGGVGRQFFRWAIDQALDRGYYMVQLTSDKARPDAIRFMNR